MSDSGLPFTSTNLLAPMEGVTEPCFRDLVLEANHESCLGGAFTEFVRVVDHPIPLKVLRAHLGPKIHAAPVGVQLMGRIPETLAETARRAAEAGAPLVDLNFGCPAKGALRGCAGSALLGEPKAMEEIIRACVKALGAVPLTAKVRAGVRDDKALPAIARAVEAGGARMITVHCRTRLEAYTPEVDWSRLARAKSSVTIPVCGNGGINTHADLQRLKRETGCDFAMVGRGALADPWIFSGNQVTRAEAARFLIAYAERLQAGSRCASQGAAARIKQLLQHWTAGGLVESHRSLWLRIADPSLLMQRLFAAAT